MYVSKSHCITHFQLYGGFQGNTVVLPQYVAVIALIGIVRATLLLLHAILPELASAHGLVVELAVRRSFDIVGTCWA